MTGLRERNVGEQAESALSSDLAVAEQRFIDRLTQVDGIVEIALAVAKPRDRAVIYSRAYHHLSVQFRDVVCDQVGQDWCSFAKWSSRQISHMFDLRSNGTYLRGITGRLHLRWIAGPFGVMFRSLIGGEEYVTSLRLANQVIFAEMALLHAELIQHYRQHPDDPPPTADIIASVEQLAEKILAKLEISPTDSRLEQPDPRLLPAAINFYHLARTSADAASAAEYMLGACTCLSSYEQKRAQGALEAAFYYPVRKVLVVWWKVLLWRITGIFSRKPITERVVAIYRSEHDRQSRLVRWAESRQVILLTRFVLQISTPVKEVLIGERLVPPRPGSPPRTAADVPDIVNDDVYAWLEPFGIPRHFAPDVVCENWVVYEQRMRFVITYFRMYSVVAEMNDDPYASDHWRLSRPNPAGPMMLDLYNSTEADAQGEFPAPSRFA